MVWVAPRFLFSALFGTPYARSAPGSGPWVAMLSFVEWDGAWQRPQHLASHLAERTGVTDSAPVLAHNARLGGIRLLVSGERQVSATLRVYRPLVLPLENRIPLFSPSMTTVAWRSPAMLCLLPDQSTVIVAVIAIISVVMVPEQIGASS